MDIHVTKKTSKSWKVVYVVMKVRRLFSEQGVSSVRDVDYGYSYIWSYMTMYSYID